MRAAVYGRVSTRKQEERNSVEAQLRDLREWAVGRGFEIAEEFVDEAVSGTKESRPQLDRLMQEARERKFEVVLVWSYDRFARNLRHLIDAMEEFRALGIGFVSLQQGIDTTTPTGRFVFHIFASLAEFEREMIRERVCAGIRRARAAGKRLGRRPKHGERAEKVVDEIFRLRAAGSTVRLIGHAVGLSPSRVCQILSIRKPTGCKPLDPAVQ